MFDIGFSEMVVIGVVALVVIGPERLPKVARTAGQLLGRAQRYMNDIKSDINRQIQIEELKAMQEQLTRQARELESSMKSQVQATEAELNKSAQGIADSLNATRKSALSEAEATLAALTATSSNAAADDTTRVTTVTNDVAATATAPAVPSEEDELYHPDKEARQGAA